MPSNENGNPNIQVFQESATSSLAESSVQPVAGSDQLGLVWSPPGTRTPEGNDSAPAVSISLENERQQPAPSAPVEPVRKHRRKRIRLGEALRKQGIDEHVLAQSYADVMGKLKPKSEDNNAGKLLVDVLKQCSKILEKENAPKPEPNTPSVPIVLVHNLPRPKRGPGTSGDKSGSES